MAAEHGDILHGALCVAAAMGGNLVASVVACAAPELVICMRAAHGRHG